MIISFLFVLLMLAAPILLIVGVIYFVRKRKKPVDREKTTITISLPNPQTDNEYLFFKFIELSSPDRLKGVIDSLREQKLPIRDKYKKAIEQKIATNVFKNPHTRESYFGNKFDFIAIDFETANNSRISACALGVVFIKEERVVDTEYFLIKPPLGTKFLKSHTDIHGIISSDVKYASTFKEIWASGLEDALNNNLVVLHNASMDASILSQLAEYYKLDSMNVEYVCTMNIASSLDYPKQLIDLCKKYEIEIGKHHDPICDAKACANVFINFIDEGVDVNKYTKRIGIKKTSMLADVNSASDYREQIAEYQDKAKERYCYVLKPDTTFPEGSVFFGKRCVISGDTYALREDLKFVITELGGKVTSALSSKTDYFITGTLPGPAKMEKYQELVENGSHIKQMEEKELMELLSDYFVKKDFKDFI